jgi:hypothetical protein
MAGQETETAERATGPAPAVETTPVGARLVEFLLQGRHFLVIREAGDAVRIDRQHPQPERGRNVAGASGLEAEEPEWRMPDNWTPAEQHYVRVTVKNAWKNYKKAQQEALEAAEREAAEREAAAA